MVEVNQGMFAWSFRQNYGTICALPLFNMLTMDSESNVSLVIIYLLPRQLPTDNL